MSRTSGAHATGAPASADAAVDVEAFQAFEREGWDRVAHLYDAVWSPLTSQFIAPLLEEAAIAPGHRVLDLACGPGYVAAAAERLGATAVAVDLSPSMVAEARRRHPGLEVRQGAAERLELPSGEFDRVLIGFGVPHLADPPAVFAEARRLLRPHGRLGFTVWAGPDASPGARLLDRTISAHAVAADDLPRGPDYHRFADSRRLEEVLVGCGYREVVSRLVVRPWCVADPRQLFEAERTAGVRMAALLARQGPERLAAIERDLAVGMEAFRAGDHYELPMAAYVVVATR
jgi:SAM-dependent methyltransferase